MRALLVALSLLPVAAHALNLGTVVPSYDGSLYVTEYPGGDKPQAGGTCPQPPTGWTGLNLGDGGGTICDNGAGDLLFTVTGTNSTDNARIIYKDCGGGECQVEGKILNNYAGSAEANAAIGVGIRESTATTSYIAQCKSLQSGGTNAVQCQHGLASSPTNVWCSASGTSRPIWVAVTYYPTNSEVKGFTSSDGATWTECFSTTRAMSNDLAYFIGGSKSATVALTATMDDFALPTEIDAYTETPAGGGAPTLTSAIPDQTGTQGVAYSLTFSSYFSGATSHSLGSAFPGALTETSDGVLSGTPNATDASSSPYSRDLCATNGSGTTCDSVSFSFSAVPGDVLVIGSGTATVDCDTFESGGPVDPDDILQIPAGTRGPLEIRDCRGSVAKPIIIRNDPAGGSAATIERTSGTGAALTLANNANFVMDGTGKWSGAPAGTCGYTYTTGATGTNNCGIVVVTTGGSGGFVIRMNGTTCSGTVSTTGGNPGPQYCTIKGVKVDGNLVSGVGLSLNDHAILFLDNDGGAGTDDDLWRENVTIEKNYIVDIGATIGEGMYIGPNQDTTNPDLPLRNIAVRHNYINNVARDCINTKSVLDGTNYYEYNYGLNCGESNEATQNRGLNLNGAANYIIRGNRFTEMGGEGMLMTWQDIYTGGGGLSPGSAYTVLIENEIYADVGTTAASDGHGLEFGHASGSPTQTTTIRHLTLAGFTGNGIDCNADANVTVYNSIISDNTDPGAAGLVGCDGSVNNSVGTVATQGFVNAGADDYELANSSSNCNAVTNGTNSPTTDYEGETRPTGANRDRGADEGALCP